ncbi:MAG: SOS response-associated peptidase family protein [Chitinophagaceae bacterium]
MCYDISYKITLQTIEDFFEGIIFDEGDQLDLSFDGTHIMGHAYGLHPIIYRHREDQLLHCRPMEWGCLPFYVKDEKQFIRQRASMLNARSERIVDDHNSYWYKIREHRCLVPVNGIYEHRAIKGWKKKVPYYITLHNQSTFFLPALYAVTELPDTTTGEMIKRYTYSIITRSANSVMRNIHNDGDSRGRMPLFLPFEQSLEWINHALPLDHYKEILNFEMPAELLQYHPVFTIRSAKMRPDDKPKNEYWHWEKLPALGEMNPD